MKKVLLASTVLAMTATVAAAEVSVSGNARMGVVSVDGDAFFSSRFRVIFTASGETDGGLSFGATVRNDQDGVAGVDEGQSTVFISGAFGKLSMGDVSGAADALVGQVSGVGYGPIDAAQEINFIGTDKTAAYYEYSAGAVTFGLGIGQINDTVLNINDDTYNIGVKYSANGYSVALAYETADAVNLNMLSLGGSATFGDITVKARVSDVNVAGADTAYALSADYKTGALTLTGFYTDYGNDAGSFNGLWTAGSTDTKHIGLGASYDLGGGATIAAGIVQQNNTGVADVTFADVGVKFTF